MTNPDRPITDDDLHGYVDGVLDDARCRVVQSYLAHNERQKRRVEAWLNQKIGLQAALAEVAVEPLPPALTLAHLVDERSRQQSAWWLKFYGPGSNLRVAAGLFLALGLGAATGWFGRGGPERSGNAPDTGVAALKLETNAAYRIFGHADTISPATALNHRVLSTEALWRAIGRKFTLPDLTGAGYTIDRIDWVATTHGPAAVVVYRNRADQRLMLLIRKMALPANSDRMSEDRSGGRSLFAWISHGVGFSVASADALDRLHRIANTIRAEERAS